MGFIPSIYDYLRVWNLINYDTVETITGQFHPEGLTQNVGSAYSEKFALNREHPVVQFLHGEVETVTFRGRFHATTVVEDVVEILEKLKSWARRDDSLERPPVLGFWAGDSLWGYLVECTMGLSNIAFDRPTLVGGLRHVTFQVNLREYKSYSIEAGTVGNTRYHRARAFDYYESLALLEYGDPMVGDVIRKLHPEKPNIQVGDVIELPTASKLRKTKTEPTSIPFQNGFGRKASPQRTLRLETFEARNRTKVSFVVK